MHWKRNRTDGNNAATGSRQGGNQPNRGPSQQQNRQRHRNQNQQQNRGQGRPHPQHQPNYNNGGGPPLPPGGIVEGILQFAEDRGDGQLRDAIYPLRPVPGDVIVPRQLIRELRLRPGLMVRGQVRGRTLARIETVEGRPPSDYVSQATLYDGTALDPQPVLRLEHNPAEPTTRIIDILAPVGFGQRGLIVAPPRTGKTILLQNIARGVNANYPNAKLILLLVDERPEEVTDMRRNVPGQVYASSNDNDVDMHLDLATLVIERCKRLVEFGDDVVVLMDSLTRLGRAFNSGGPSGGRTLTGGLDNRALEIPKKLFGAARKLEHGGSLTILATCLIDTGSKMDQVIFEEFKGTGNMELTLDRNLSNQRIYPALNIPESGTRKEEKLLDPRHLNAARNIRRHLTTMGPAQGIKTLLESMTKHKTNEALFGALRA